MSDGELVRQVLDGRTSAYDQLARAWSPRVLALCHARTGRGDVAEELAQETLVRGFRAIRTLSQPEKFGQWLCGIAARVCLDWLKTKTRGPVTFNALGDVHNPQALPDRRGEDCRQEDVASLMTEVQKLPENLREVLMLYYYHKSTYQELAELLGVSAATINARLTQARQILRQRLGVPAPRQVERS